MGSGARATRNVLYRGLHKSQGYYLVRNLATDCEFNFRLSRPEQIWKFILEDAVQTVRSHENVQILRMDRFEDNYNMIEAY